MHWFRYEYKNVAQMIRDLHRQTNLDCALSPKCGRDMDDFHTAYYIIN